MKNKYYIGSTVRQLCHRLYQHKSCKSEGITSKQILQYDDAYIELLELFPCNSKEELNKREGEIIRLHKDNCVNIYMPCRTKKEYYNDNKEKILEEMEKYRNNNKEKLLEYSKKHYQKNKEELNKKIKCSKCDIEINKNSLSRHMRRKHLEI
jgi:hypothetical protein